MSMNPLNDISQVYLEKVSNVSEKKDDSYLETDMKKRQKNNEKARKELAKGPQMKNPHFEEKQLDPVGQEDADVDNDGKKNTKSDKYLKNRRKAIAKAIKEAKHATAKQMHSPHEVPSGDIKKLVKKAVKRIDTDVDGDTDNNDKAKGELGEFIPGVGNKRLYSTTKTATAKESYSNWRDDLREVVGEDNEDSEDKKQVKEKNVKNNIKINPKISEEVIIVEMVELSKNWRDDFKALEIETVDLITTTDHLGEAAPSQEDKVRLQNEKRKQILLRLQQEIMRKKKSGQLASGNAMESVKEEASDELKDRRMERGGVGGNQRYNKPISNTPNTFGKKKPKYDGMSALERVKADIRAKHGKGAIKEDAKMAKQSDEKLAALHKQVSASDQSLPSNQFMMKRVSKEMNRRKKST